MIFNATVFADYLVWLERRGLPSPSGRRAPRAGEERIIAFDQPCCHLRFAENFDFDRPILRLSYSSLTEPEEIYDFDLATGARTLLKRQIIPIRPRPRRLCGAAGFRHGRRMAKRCRSRWSGARTGRPVPARFCFMAMAPMASSLPDSFDETRFSLIDRGFVYAIAHVRGGTEKGSALVRGGQVRAQAQHIHAILSPARAIFARKA